MGSTLGGNSSTVVLAGKIMVIFIIVMLLITIFVMFLHLYAKWHWWQIEVPEAHRRQQQQQRRRRRLVFVPAEDEDEGLHPAVLKSLPIIRFSHGHGNGDEECVCGVCLCEVVEGDKARVLPKCNHCFHVDCIDMWFRSHATCPLCRQNPAPQLEIEMMTTDQTSSLITSNSMEKQEYHNTTNPFSTGPSSSSSSLVIDIPCLSPSPSLSHA